MSDLYKNKPIVTKDDWKPPLHHYEDSKEIKDLKRRIETIEQWIRDEEIQKKRQLELRSALWNDWEKRNPHIHAEAKARVKEAVEKVIEDENRTANEYWGDSEHF